MSIPIIDFDVLSNPGVKIDESLSQVGFMMLKNIGIDHSLLQQVYQASKDFFHQDAEFKNQFLYRSAEENFGYQGVMEENLDPNAPADLKETFTMRNILSNQLADERWPSAEFKSLMQAFFSNALEAAYAVQRVMAKQLDVDEDFFTKVHSGQSVSLRLLYYPPVEAETLEQHQMGAGAHTDYGFLTLLFQDDVGGLQVLDKSDSWVDVIPVQDGIVINSGDLLEQWTNCKYKSTMHRVKSRTDTRERLSIAVFIDPDKDALVETLPSCTSPDNPSRFTPITAGEHLKMKLDATHKDRFNT